MVVNSKGQIVDGFVLSCGRMFSPVQDRDGPGPGFAHHLGDVATISRPEPGSLTNFVRPGPKHRNGSSAPVRWCAILRRAGFRDAPAHWMTGALAGIQRPLALAIKSDRCGT